MNRVLTTRTSSGEEEGPQAKLWVPGKVRMLPQSAPNTLKVLMVHKDASWPPRIHPLLGYDLLFTLKRIQKLNHPEKVGA